jgi:hypothetical protein
MNYTNLPIEEYLECLIETKDKIYEVEETFLNLGFKTTHLSEDRVALIKDDIYFEMYKECDTQRYVFRLITEENENYLYTFQIEKINTKIKNIINMIGETKNEVTRRNICKS